MMDGTCREEECTSTPNNKTWQKTTLGALIDFRTDKISTSCVSWENYVSTENMRPYLGGVSFCERVLNFPNDRVKGYQKRDTLFSNIRTHFRKVWKADREGGVSSDILVCRTKDESICNPEYLFYILSSQDFIDYTILTSKGVAFPRGDKDALKKWSVSLPPLLCQQRISHILGLLDEKIAVNKRTNKTLEAMSKEVFRDWFVEFGPTKAKMRGEEAYLPKEIWNLFPDRLDDDGVPLGWCEKPLDQVANFLNGLALQKYPQKGKDYLPVVKISQLRSGNTLSAEHASTEIPSDYIVDDGDVLFSWSGTLLHCLWMGGRGALNQHLFKVTSEDFPSWFYFHWIGEHMPWFREIAAYKATTIGHIQRRHLTEAMTVIGDSAIMKAANEWISPLWEKMIANEEENKALSNLRDFLLPKLMCGKIDVNTIKLEGVL